MKGWVIATVAGRCAYDGATWPEGTRVFRLQGTGWGPKDYCPACAPHHGATVDGPDFEAPAVSVAKPLAAMVARVGDRFDARRAQTGERD